MTVAPELEKRSFTAEIHDLELRDSANGSGDYTLTGHAAVFDRWSEELATWAGSFRERIAQGAFTDVLKTKPDVRLLLNHDGLPLARTKSGTLELSQDEQGLKVWARIAPTPMGTELRTAMQRGDVDQMSFAFTIAPDGADWNENEDTGDVERTITRIGELYDVSVVTFPAYPDTEATIREIRAAQDAGILNLVAPAETDPAGDAHSGDTTEVAQAETDPAGDEVDPLRAMKAASSETVRRERESLLLLKKELSR